MISCAQIAQYLSAECVGVVFAENALPFRLAFLIQRQRAVVIALLFKQECKTVERGERGGVLVTKNALMRMKLNN